MTAIWYGFTRGMWPDATEFPRKQKWGSHMLRMSGWMLVSRGVSRNPRVANNTHTAMTSGPANGAIRRSNRCSAVCGSTGVRSSVGGRGPDRSRGLDMLALFLLIRGGQARGTTPGPPPTSGFAGSCGTGPSYDRAPVKDRTSILARHGAGRWTRSGESGPPRQSRRMDFGSREARRGDDSGSEPAH